MVTVSYVLEIDHQARRVGPLALLAPQAAQAVSTSSSIVRIRDRHGRAARVQLVGDRLLATWDQPNELFPDDGPLPPWIGRLETLLADLGLT